MNVAIKILQEELDSLKNRVHQGVKVYPLVEQYKDQIPDIELAIHNLKMLEPDSQEVIKAEDCLLESAFLLKNGIRLMVGSSCQYGITTYQCDENWKPTKYACKGAPLMGFDTYTDFHKHIRKMHGEENLVKERSSKLS